MYIVETLFSEEVTSRWMHVLIPVHDSDRSLLGPDLKHLSGQSRRWILASGCGQVDGLWCGCSEMPQNQSYPGDHEAHEIATVCNELD